VGRYTDGTKCGDTPRTVTVTYICAPDAAAASVESVNEPETCKYTAELRAPELCESAERALEILARRRAAAAVDVVPASDGDDGDEDDDDAAGGVEVAEAARAGEEEGADEEEVGREAVRVVVGSTASPLGEDAGLEEELQARLGSNNEQNEVVVGIAWAETAEKLRAENAMLREKLARLESLITQGAQVLGGAQRSSSEESGRSSSGGGGGGGGGNSAAAVSKRPTKVLETVVGSEAARRADPSSASTTTASSVQNAKGEKQSEPETLPALADGTSLLPTLITKEAEMPPTEIGAETDNKPEEKKKVTNNQMKKKKKKKKAKTKKKKKKKKKKTKTTTTLS
jgi:hypothetical protein